MDIEYLNKLAKQAIYEAMINKPAEISNKCFITYYRDLPLKKINRLSEDYQRTSLFIRTDVYPLLWIIYQLIENIKIQHYRLCWFTYNCCLKLNNGKDFIPYNEYAPKNIFMIVWRFIKSKW